VDVTTVAVTFNDDTHLKTHLNEVERIGEMEVIATAKEVAAITGGVLMPVRDVRAALDDLRARRPEVVFNLCEGVGGKPRWEMHFGLALEMLGIPFTGADPTAAGICGDKALTRKLLQTAGIPIPRDYTAGAAGRWIVKPALEDAGIGIEAAAVCSSPDEVAARVEHVRTTYRQPAVVEEFIDGAELNQALYFTKDGPVVLPPGEIVFAGSLSATERVVGWKAKWAEDSDEDRGTVNRTPAQISPAVRDELASLAVRAASVLAIGGYCRFDVRQRPGGELCIIDVNPNPDIGEGSGFRKALAAAAIPFEEFVRQLMIAAQSRHRP
jgi:D-alanine-D-alanine ligase